MKRIMLLVTVALVMAAMLVAAGPAYAFHVETHPFCDTGQQYAHEHIRFLAQQQGLGPAHGHTPGLEHSGFSVCDPSFHAGS